MLNSREDLRQELSGIRETSQNIAPIPTMHVEDPDNGVGHSARTSQVIEGTNAHIIVPLPLALNRSQEMNTENNRDTAQEKIIL